MLVGCQVPAPPPVMEAIPKVTTRPVPEPEPREPSQWPLEPDVEEEPKSTVSLALLDSAGQLAATGRTDEAVETLERAIRIEPRRGDLWLRLARLQFNAGHFAQAEQNARKGLLFLTPGGEEARDAWLLIAAAREALGHIEEARSIRARWGVFRG
ncbi:MAG: tetratricopeptide repeat protein [Gammaproteobacteria bacterium]|nr:tetratricopeptide repeat protein [Gammaproteobacteria bacterium]